MKQHTTYFQPTKILEKTIFFIDLDGTLVDTNYANYLAYHYAIKQILGFELSYDKRKRFIRSDLNKIFPNIKKSDLKKIIRLKENKYKNYLDTTKVNEYLFQLLERFYKNKKIILVTKCHKQRAEETLSYHNLNHYFSNKVFSKGGNKYKEAIDNLELSASSIVVFEDDDIEIENAVKAGVPKQNIQKITQYTCC